MFVAVEKIDKKLEGQGRLENDQSSDLPRQTGEDWDSQFLKLAMCTQITCRSC